jgi:hypothetical protein
LDISDGEEFLEYKEVEKAKRRVTVFQISNLSALCACVTVYGHWSTDAITYMWSLQQYSHSYVRLEKVIRVFLFSRLQAFCDSTIYRFPFFMDNNCEYGN